MTADLEDCRLAFGPRSLVVVGGVPGAGKTILLDRLGALPGTVVLDSAEPIRRWRRLPLPYRLLRPLVHSEHHVRIAFAVLLAVCDGVVVHEPATRAASRRRLLGRARLTGRPAHLVLLDVDPATARAGQIARGRLMPAAAHRRHAARWETLREAAATGVVPGEEWTSVGLLEREAAESLRTVLVKRRGASPLSKLPRVAG